jgi:hypothetical protein
VLGEAQLIRAWLGAGKQIGSELEMEFPREWPRNEFCLVVTAFAETGWVKRYRDDDIRCEMFGVACGELRETISKPSCERRNSIVFNEEDRADHWVIVVSKAASEAEAIRFETAESAEKVGRGPNLM